MTIVAPPFADVLNSYMNLVVHELYPEPAEFEQIKKVIHSYVSNLRRESTSETKIYELLDELNPLLGNPLTFNEEFVMKFDKGYKKLKEHKKGSREKQRCWLCGPRQSFQIGGSVTSLSS
jgi:hypothetical protein